MRTVAGGDDQPTPHTLLSGLQTPMNLPFLIEIVVAGMVTAGMVTAGMITGITAVDTGIVAGITAANAASDSDCALTVQQLHSGDRSDAV